MQKLGKLFAKTSRLLLPTLNKIYLEGLFYAVIIAAFLVRFVDLNYNSPFNDEAVYIVVGRMGLFASDWWSYGASIWMAGLPYIYPTLTAMAYQTGGIFASRLLNVVLGTLLVEEVYRLVKLLNLFDAKTNQIAALIAAFIAAFSAVGIYVSKLATYDVLSFLLLFFAINAFLKSGTVSNGKYYFLAALALYVAFLTKIVAALFFPPLLLLTLVAFFKRPVKDRTLALKYFYFPLAVGLLAYAFLNLNNLLLFIATHHGDGKARVYTPILSLIWRVSGWLYILSVPAAVILARLKAGKEAIALIILAAVIPIFHIAMSRHSTLDKHMYLSVIFLSVIIGYAGSIVLSKLKSTSRVVSLVSMLLVGGWYAVSSYQELYRIEHSWKNSTTVKNFLQDSVRDDVKVLTENGGAVILDLYDVTFPPKNIVTFDWIDYSQMAGDDAYIQAVRDEYFDFIELDDQFAGREELKAKLRTEIEVNYDLVFQDDSFKVYGRKTPANLSQL